MSLSIRNKIKMSLCAMPKSTSNNCLKFTAEQANSTIDMSVTGSPTKGQSFEYSTDGSSWNTFTPGSTTITLANIGDFVYFRGNNTTVSESSSMYYRFVMKGVIAASGSIQSLLDGNGESTVISSSYCYYRMFYYCTSLTTAPALPATTLASSCYERMFYMCTSLTTAPALPATTLASSCYNGMFVSCASLTTVPALPATTLVSNCYQSMFQGCSALQVYSSSGTGHTKAWRIPTSGTGTITSFTNMFYNTIGSYKSSTSVTINQTFYTQNTPVS